MFSKARDCCCKCHGHIKLHLVKKIICSWFPSPHFRNRNIPLIVGNLPFFSLHVCAECRPSVIFFNSVIFLPTMFIHPIYYWAWVSAFLILIWQVSLLLHGTLSIYLSYFFFALFPKLIFFLCKTDHRSMWSPEDFILHGTVTLLSLREGRESVCPHTLFSALTLEWNLTAVPVVNEMDHWDVSKIPSLILGLKQVFFTYCFPWSTNTVRGACMQSSAFWNLKQASTSKLENHRRTLITLQKLMQVQLHKPKKMQRGTSVLLLKDN